MEERKGPYRDNFEAASERGRPAPVATSFLEDFPGENQPNLQRRPTQISHSLTASQRNTPNSLQPSYRHTATIGYETPDLLNFEDALSENNLRLESPYRPLELPSRFGFEEESSRRSYTPFPTLDTPPQSQSRLRRRRSSADSLFDSSSHTTQSNPFNTFVVLTQDSPIMPASSRWSKSSKDTSRTTSEAPPRPAKRRKPEPVKTEIEEVDLRDVESDTDLARVLERQRVASVKAQQEEADKPTKLANVTCVVCMEELTNITATHCGHVFCHTCLMEALIAGENQAAEPGKGLSKCPICRKKVKRPKDNKDTGQVVPLEIMFKKRAGAGKGKGKGKA